MGAPVPDLSKTSKSTKPRPSTATNKPSTGPKHIEDLPQPTYKGILNHLLEKKIYKDTDIKVLYVRLCYAYGEDCVDEVWEQVMDHLEGWFGRGNMFFYSNKNLMILSYLQLKLKQ